MAMPIDSSVLVIGLGRYDGLPLIICGECGKWRVVRCKLKQPWSEGRVLYYCPVHKVGLEDLDFV